MSKPKKNTRTITKIWHVNFGRVTADGYVLKLYGVTPQGNEIEFHLVLPWYRKGQ